jgi:hypothetical protein
VTLAFIVAAAFLLWQDRRYVLEDTAAGWHDLALAPAAAVSFPEAPLSFPEPAYTRYEMALSFDPDKRTLSGHSLIYTRNTTGGDLTGLPLLCYPNAFRTREGTPAPAASYAEGFNPGWMEIASARMNGAPAEVAAGTELTAWLQFGAPVLPGEDFYVELAWQVLIPQAQYRFGAANGVFALGHAYPALTYYDADGWHTAYNSKIGDPFCLAGADYIVSLQLPPGYDIIANAAKQPEDGGGLRRYEAAAAREFALCVVSRYLQTSMRFGAVTIHTYYPLGGRQPDVRKIAAILDYYAERFGAYRLPEFKVVYLPMQGFDGMEYDGLILLREEYLFEELPNEAFILAHEIAHQWWYGAVGSDQLRHPWMDEGLANWSAYCYLHDAEGEALPAAGRAVSINRPLRDFSGRGDYYATAYTQGASFWAALTQQIGEARVFEALRLYAERERGQIAAPEDLKAAIQEAAGQPLSAFFSAWL